MTSTNQLPFSPSTATKPGSINWAMTCVASSTISHVAGLMVDNHLDAIPVVEGEGRLVGLVTSSDLIQLLRDHDQKEGKVIPFTFNLRQQEHAVA